MPRRITLALSAALAASALAASPALAKPVHVPADAASRGWSPAQELPAYPQPEPENVYKIGDGRSPDTKDAAKDAAVQPGQPTWPADPKVLTGPRPRPAAVDSGDADGIWLVIGIGLAGATLAGAAGAGRYARVRARRVAV